MIYQFEPGQKYSFDTYAPQILGTEFKTVVVKSVTDYEDAISEEDVQVLHSQILGYITDSTVSVPADFRKLTYIKIDTGVGKRRFIAVEWIKQNTITKISELNIDVTIFRVSDPAKVRLVREALSQNGFTDFQITTREA
ncbi:MAG: hypothetical protein M0R77_00835 [Gammaproteobacteria bacterium]|nr:hypothetical protein [Acholeplasmataceae bacterium]MCK9529100.1 hypothetical protein [Gammaproteobacteria bacterium]